MIEMLKYVKSEIASLRRKREELVFANPPKLRKFLRLQDLTNNEIDSEWLTSENTSTIEASPEKRSQINKDKSGKCGSSISLKPVKGNHKLPVK